MTPQSGHLELDRVELERRTQLRIWDLTPIHYPRVLCKLARSLAWMPGQEESRHFRDRCELSTVIAAVVDIAGVSRHKRLLPMIFGACRKMSSCSEGSFRRRAEPSTPLINFPRFALRTAPLFQESPLWPRTISRPVLYQFRTASFTSYIQAFQEITVLKWQNCGC
jgi:hypothetical protein